MQELKRTIWDVLARIHIRAIRIYLHTPEVMATVPMLRGVWGAQLHERYPALYRDVFEQRDNRDSVPKYIFRPAVPGIAPRPALEWILFNVRGGDFLKLLECWDEALRIGIGKQRVPANTIFRVPLAPDNTPSFDFSDGFTLDLGNWPFHPEVPCRLNFINPLRIYRKGRLVRQPSLQDIVVAAFRRLEAYVDSDRLVFLKQLREEALLLSSEIPVKKWQGKDRTFVRYSGRQQREVNQEGVIGYLDFPAGPRELAPLLSAALWLHLGKGTVMGLGQPVVQQLFWE